MAIIEEVFITLCASSILDDFFPIGNIYHRITVINDVRTTSNSTMATFADDIAAMAIRQTVES
jgi:hypothetical protein